MGFNQDFEIMETPNSSPAIFSQLKLWMPPVSRSSPENSRPKACYFPIILIIDALEIFKKVACGCPLYYFPKTGIIDVPIIFQEFKSFKS